ncbi:uncharacterized protein GIQ15_01948 [Arthroderma uncinatum]|uniref:uncharacterized protein n=1 Tax=Arthroderma uncinatum TaxID=74035 RepID=UPI00144AEA6E|nr:uncharacterized protein GIQ15_01948 [Arthroderma uncinatum]KAF3492431.1 hypothetical protein GIQ15_01948 [Arthroderma uncinatum]
MTIQRGRGSGRRYRAYDTGLPRGHFAKVREQFARAGPTKRKRSENSTIGIRTVMNKLEQYCPREHNKTPREWVETLEAPDAKAFFSWLRQTHGSSIKRDSVPGSYWRRIMMFHLEVTQRSVDRAIQADVDAFLIELVKEWGLLPPKQKETANKKVVYTVLVANWTRCEKVYPDERQRLQVSAGILLGCITSSRLVSLFDTRKGESSGQTQTAATLSTLSRVASPEHSVEIPPTSSRKSAAGHRSRVESWLDECAPQAKRRVVGPGASLPERARKTLPARAARGTVRASIPNSDIDLEMTESTSISGSGDSVFSDSAYSGSRGEAFSLTAPIDEGPGIPVEDGRGPVNLAPDGSNVAGEGFDVADLISDGSVTDDGYNAGPEETGAIVWRHISFHIIRDPRPCRPNIPIAKIALLHTKGDDGTYHPVKIFTIVHNPEPLFDLLGQLFSMAFKDEVFEVAFRKLEDIYWHEIPNHRPGMQLKMKREKLDLPTFRNPEQTENGYCTSSKMALKATTFSRDLKGLGFAAGLKCSFGQYRIRRLAINALNGKVHETVRNQVTDHIQNTTVKYYLDEEIRADTEALIMEVPSNKEVRDVAQSMLLDVDVTAPTKLTDEMSQRIAEHPTTRSLAEKNQKLTEKIKSEGYPTVEASRGKTRLYREKMEIQSKLNCWKFKARAHLLNHARKRHFRDADTERFNRRIRGDGEESLPPPPELQIAERRQIAELTCKIGVELTEEERFARTRTSIELWMKLQGRKEPQRRGRPRKLPTSHSPQDPVPAPTQPGPATTPATTMEDEPLSQKLELNPHQCPFCAADPRLPSEARDKIWKRNKLWDHVEKTVHREELQAYSSGTKRCSFCWTHRIAVFPSSVMAFKLHTLETHKVPLRG